MLNRDAIHRYADIGQRVSDRIAVLHQARMCFRSFHLQFNHKTVGCASQHGGHEPQVKGVQTELQGLARTGRLAGHLGFGDSSSRFNEGWLFDRIER